MATIPTTKRGQPDPLLHRLLQVLYDALNPDGSEGSGPISISQTSLDIHRKKIINSGVPVEEFNQLRGYAAQLHGETYVEITKSIGPDGRPVYSHRPWSDVMNSPEYQEMVREAANRS